MGDFEQLFQTYAMRASGSSASKIDTLMSIARLRDARVVPFLLDVLSDPDEPEQLRIHVLKALRAGDPLVTAADRRAVAKAFREVLAHQANEELRVQAALGLGEFTDIDGVLSTLSTVSLAQTESIDLRYTAFTSLERGGLKPECIQLLRLISTDETLGASARSVLSILHVDG
jgi:HEAT repeat protein